jgi:hypothetical protein
MAAVETKLIEVTQGAERGFNWGKFLLGRFDHEWMHPSAVGEDSRRPLLYQCGWTRATGHLWVLDLQTGEGAFFRPGGSAHADLEKHRIWVCPMFEPFLEWLYAQDLSDLRALPPLVELPDAPAALSGYRRPGPSR